MSNKISDFFNNIPKLDVSKLIENMPKYEPPQIEFQTLLEIKNPIYETNELLNEHLNIIKEQNQLLKSSLEQAIENYKLLKEQYDLQVQANKDNEKDIRRNKIISYCSIGIAVIGIIIGAII